MTFSGGAAAQRLHILKVFRSHTHTHTYALSRLDSSARVIGSSRRPLHDSTRHSQQTNVLPTVGIEPKIPASERSQTQALDRATTGTGIHNMTNIMKWDLAKKHDTKGNKRGEIE
jgi:hypothetical protein